MIYEIISRVTTNNTGLKYKDESKNASDASFQTVELARVLIRAPNLTTLRNKHANIYRSFSVVNGNT